MINTENKKIECQMANCNERGTPNFVCHQCQTKSAFFCSQCTQLLVDEHLRIEGYLEIKCISCVRQFLKKTVRKFMKKTEIREISEKQKMAWIKERSEVRKRTYPEGK